MLARRLDSTLIERITLDEDAGTLCIAFRNGRRYIYEGVSRTMYEAFKQAPSAGAFFNERIRGHFPCRPETTRRRYPLDA